MKYTIDEEKGKVTIHSVGTKLRVEHLMMVLRDLDDFEIIFELDEPTQQQSTMITDSGYEDIKYVYNKICDCGRISAVGAVLQNGLTCNCELKNKK